jgi:hypothetical protein
MTHRALPALAACCLFACGVASLSTPPPPTQAPGGDETPGAAGSSGAIAASAPETIVPVASASAPERLRPYQGAFLATDADRVFPERAFLARTRSLRLRRGSDEAPTDGFDEMTSPRPVTVVEKDAQAIRILFEVGAARMLFWAAPGAFALVPGKPTRLALRPGVYPQGPPGDPQRDEVGVWVMPGWRPIPLSSKDGWVEIEVNDTDIKARGWLDSSAFEPVYTPETARPAKYHAGVVEGAWLLASPRGSVIAQVRAPEGEVPGVNRWFEGVGPPIQGFRLVRYGGRHAWMQGYVANALFRPPEGGTSYGRGYGDTGYGTRSPKKAPLELQVEPGTDLFDAPDGDLCGRTRGVLRVPDRHPLRVEGGRRQIEVPMNEVGYVRVWVDEKRVGLIPAASASGAPSAAPVTSAPRP